MKGPKTLSSQIVYQGFFFSLRQDKLERHDGEMRDFTSVDLPGDAVVVLAEDSEGRFILNHEYRHPIGQFILGCPGGGLEPGEEPLQAAQRELQEESGYCSDELVPLGTCYPIPGICSQKIHYFHAKNARPSSGQSLDPFEFIEPVLKTQKELEGAILSGTLIDGLLCTALWYKFLRSC